MKIVIFGTGLYYRKYAQFIYKNHEVVALLDNNSIKWGSFLDGVQIHNPNDIFKFEFDKIVLLSSSDSEMHRQLIEIGVPKEKMVYWEIFRGQMEYEKSQLYDLDCLEKEKKSSLLITTDLGYHGGSIAASYAAMALQRLGYFVILAAPQGNSEFICELEESGLDVVICPTLPCISEKLAVWIRKFDVVIVNTFPMISCACEISKYSPVLWWVHEASEKYSCIYPNVIYKYSSYADSKKFLSMNVYAVSTLAKKNFNRYFPNIIKKILMYGIPDKFNMYNTFQEKIIFAVIGYVSNLKGQLNFLNAILQLKEEEQKRIECWIIGNIRDDAYGTEIRKIAEKTTGIKILGKKNRKELEDIYEKIDVVCCPSLEETMSIVVTEGLMYGKVCIISDQTGIADFIENKKNGLVCKAGDERSICEQIRWVLENPEKLQQIQYNARKTYLKYFTMDKFGVKLNDAVDYIIKSYKR